MKNSADLHKKQTDQNPYGFSLTACEAATVNLESFYFFPGNVRSYVKLKPSRNGEITLSFTDVGKSCPRSKFLIPQIFF